MTARHAAAPLQRPGAASAVIRFATQADAAALAELAERTFRDAFEAMNDPADMALHCERTYGAELQAAEIADPEVRTLVVERAGRLVAFAQLHLAPHGPPCVPDGEGVVELRRIYVDQRFHGHGLAQELMRRVLDLAARHGARQLWLGVWEHNARAQAFYRRFGFTEVGAHTYVVGSDPQRDLVLIRPVTAADLAAEPLADPLGSA
jgi:ribosomal protein S18 acetylase RimI-like enzyme